MAEPTEPTAAELAVLARLDTVNGELAESFKSHIERVVSKRGTVTYALGTRGVIVPANDWIALVLAPVADNRDPDRAGATLRLDRAGLLDYAALLLAAAAELPDLTEETS